MDKIAKYSVSEKELTVDEVGLVTNCLLLIRWVLKNADDDIRAISYHDDIMNMCSQDLIS